MTKHIVGGTCTTGGSQTQSIINRRWMVKEPSVDTVYMYEFFPTGRPGEEAPKLGMHRSDPSNPNNKEHLHASLTGVKVVFAYAAKSKSGRIYLDVPDYRIGPISRGPADPITQDYSTEQMPKADWDWLFSALFSGNLGAAGSDVTPFTGFDVTNGVASQFAPIKLTPDPSKEPLGKILKVEITTSGVTSVLEFTSEGSPRDDGVLFPATLTKSEWKDRDFPLNLPFKAEAQMANRFYAEWPEDDH